MNRKHQENLEMCQRLYDKAMELDDIAKVKEYFAFTTGTLMGMLFSLNDEIDKLSDIIDDIYKERYKLWKEERKKYEDEEE